MGSSSLPSITATGSHADPNKKFHRLVLNCSEVSASVYIRGRAQWPRKCERIHRSRELPASTTPEGEELQHMKATWKKSAAVLMALSVVVAACGDDDDEDAGGEATAEDTAEATAEATAATAPPKRPPPPKRPLRCTAGGESLLDGDDPVRAAVRRQDGRDPLAGPQQRERPDRRVSDYIDAYQPLIDCTGVEITWSGTDQFETEVNVRLEGGNAPDVIDFPQPGLLTANATAGYLIPLPEDVAAHVTNDFIAGWDTFSTVDGTGLRHARSLQRQVDGVVQPADVRRCRLRDPADARRAEDAVRPDRHRRRHAVVHRRRVRRRHRLGAHRLDGGLHAPHPRRGGLRPVGQPRDPVQRPEGRRTSPTPSART